jgi:hypothetical protein
VEGCEKALSNIPARKIKTITVFSLFGGRDNFISTGTLFLFLKPVLFLIFSFEKILIQLINMGLFGKVFFI